MSAEPGAPLPCLWREGQRPISGIPRRVSRHSRRSTSVEAVLDDTARRSYRITLHQR